MEVGMGAGFGDARIFVEWCVRKCDAGSGGGESLESGRGAGAVGLTCASQESVWQSGRVAERPVGWQRRWMVRRRRGGGG